jgi:hypothetical protein
MTRAQWLALLGGMLLLAGLGCSLGSTYYQVKALGEARKGVAVLGPEKGSPAWQEKDRHVARSDWLFGIGLLLTATGITLQVSGAMLPAPAPAAAGAAPAAPAPPPPSPGVLWNTYQLEVSLYRDYLKLAFKVNAFYYVGVGAILSFFSTHTENSLVWLPLAFLLVLSVALAGFSLYAARRSGMTRQHIIMLAEALGLLAFPEARVLTVLLWLSAVLILATASGIGGILWWWACSGGG